MKIKFLFAFVFILTSRINTIAQKSDTIKFDYLNFYFNGQVGVPAKEFREVIDNSVGDLGVGLAGGFLFSPFGQKKPSPILLGFDIGYINYGAEKINANSSNPAIKVTHNIYSFDGMARLRNPNHYKKNIIPFIDGLLGVKLNNTRVKIDKDLIDVIFNNNQEEVIENVNNTRLNFGLGAGFYTLPKKINGAGFMMRVLYMWGDEVDYVVRNSVKMNNGTLTYDTGKANTSMVTIQLGITGFAFSKLVK